MDGNRVLMGCGEVNRNVLLAVLHCYIRRIIEDLPSWVADNADEVRGLVSLSKPAMRRLLAAELALDKYSRRVGFAWCRKQHQVYARVKLEGGRGGEEEGDVGESSDVALKTRYRLNRNVLRRCVALYLAETLVGLPEWLRDHVRSVSRELRRDPGLIGGLAGGAIDVQRCGSVIHVLWAGRSIEVNIHVHNSTQA